MTHAGGAGVVYNGGPSTPPTVDAVGYGYVPNTVTPQGQHLQVRARIYSLAVEGCTLHCTRMGRKRTGAGTGEGSVRREDFA